jgi:hypothetical protein
MRQRNRAGGKAKTQRRKTSKGDEAARRRGSPAAAKETNIAQVIRERDVGHTEIERPIGLLDLDLWNVAVISGHGGTSA